MGFKTRLFGILFAAGLAGVLSFLFVDVSALIAILPQMPEQQMPFSPQVMMLVSLIQPTVLLAIAVLVGIAAAGKVGLHAPVAEALAGGGNFAAALRPQILPGVIAGLATGVAILALWLVTKPFMPADFIAHAEDFNRLIPPITRFLYGGFTEELLIRWGLVSILVWAAWRLFQKGRGEPRKTWFVGAILIMSIVFGVGHLPVAFALTSEVTPPIVLYVISANAAFALVAGFLFWKKGLESAMIAHIAAHVVIVTALYFGA